MKGIILIILAVVVLSCSSESVEVGMMNNEVEEMLGTPKTIIEKEGIPDVYTNKMIKIEVWNYGEDTSIVFANSKVQNIVTR